MLKTEKVIVVEGKYDAIKLANIIDATVLQTDGFGIFKDKEKQALLRRLAKTRGLIVLTDSDSAGFLIRNFLGNAVPQEQITNVYIPDLYGKERRKAKPGAEGKLGVEGIPDAVLIEAFRRAGITEHPEPSPAERGRQITTVDFYKDGLSGGPGSKEKRRQLLQKLDLPERMTGKQLLKIINLLITYEEYCQVVQSIA